MTKYRAFYVLHPDDQALILSRWQQPDDADPFTHAHHWAFPVNDDGRYLGKHMHAEPAYDLAGNRRGQFWTETGSPSDD